jgi:transcriptional regulator with XRE-family HTH domain
MRGPAMEDNVSPLMLRRRLRTELLTARTKKGLTQQQVAEAMDWSLSKMNRIEQAKTGISINDLRALLSLYDVTNKSQSEQLIGMARQAKQSPWWPRRFSEVASKELLELINYESAASAIRQFETSFVPGILQTEDYASAVLRVFHGENSAPERVDALVDLRTRRRDLLSSDNAPKFSFLLDESVIHRLVGSPSVMGEQLESLVKVAELPNIMLQIVPFSAGLHPGMKGPFEVVEFDDAPDENIVFIERPGGSLISDDSKTVESYLEDFRRIAGKSLTPADSAERLRTAASAMT